LKIKNEISDFNLTGFREVKMLSTETGFALSPKQWISLTNANIPLGMYRSVEEKRSNSKSCIP
jgi:hypothetical protein